MKKKYNYIGESQIKRIIKDKQEYLNYLNGKITLCLRELNRLERDEYRDWNIGAVSLKGKPYDREQLSRSNTQMDTCDILESLQKTTKQDILFYQNMLRSTIEEKSMVEQIWLIYIGLDFRLHEILTMRFVENLTWDAIANDTSLNNRQISEHIKLAINAIQHEYQYGIGTSRDKEFVEKEEYLKLIQTNSSKNKNQIPGQITIEELILQGQ